MGRGKQFPRLKPQTASPKEQSKLRAEEKEEMDKGLGRLIRARATKPKIWTCVTCKKKVDFIHWQGTEYGSMYQQCEKCSGVSRDWGNNS